MKTRFILHGGMMRYENSYNDSFFQEITKGLVDEDVVLWIGFARRNQEQREITFARDKELILAQTNKNLLVDNAVLDTLLEQVKLAKVIFVTGGDTKKLQKDLESVPGFVKALQGKLYAGSSAGASICSSFYLSCSDQVVVAGMNILPIRLMVHYGSIEFNSTAENLEKLKSCSNDLELIVLPESQWQVKEIDL